MIIPSIMCWLITTFYIENCWAKSSKMSVHASKPMPLPSQDDASLTLPTIPSAEPGPSTNPILKSSATASATTSAPALRIGCFESDGFLMVSGPLSPTPLSPLTPRRKRAKKRQEAYDKIVRVVSSPFPYMVLILLVAMIVMIFVDVMSISGLICVSAICMVLCLVLGNHWRGRPIWYDESTEDEQDGTFVPLSREEKNENLTEFFEELFNSLDYSLLIIFLGTFIVVANIDSTGFPHALWNKIVGKTPFSSFGSVIGISLFVLLASQLLGNVAVIQMAKSNVHDLDDSQKKYAWAILSFVATVGGNLLITGSAANIIVTEKAARIDPKFRIDFWQHY